MNVTRLADIQNSASLRDGKKCLVDVLVCVKAVGEIRRFSKEGIDQQEVNNFLISIRLITIFIFKTVPGVVLQKG